MNFELSLRQAVLRTADRADVFPPHKRKMPPVHFKVSRALQKARDSLPGARSLNRGIHVGTNKKAVAEWKSNPTAKRKDPSELLVHHQKIDEDLKDVYARTAALQKDNMTMTERKEEAWKQFERCGGRRPKEVVGFKQHLAKVSAEKKKLREDAAFERVTGGDEADMTKGSAADREKKKRISKFDAGRKERQRLFHRQGDPNPMKQTGRFDRHTNTLTVSDKVARKIKRSVKHDEWLGAVKKQKGGKTMWDSRGRGDVNRPDKLVVRDDSASFRVGRHKFAQKKGGGGGGGKRR